MKKVLVVDGKLSNRDLVRTVLESSGYKVADAPDAAEALRSARDWRPDLIILGLHTPGIDGCALLHEIRCDQELNTMPVMVLDSNAIPGDRERILAAGFTCYLARPVALPTLRSEAERLLS